MSLRIEIKIERDEDLAQLGTALLDKAGLHARMAGDAERWVKGPDVAGKVSAEQHRTASKLGAAPTGHLEEAYDGIESTSDETAARLLIPERTRLSAAFDKLVLRATNSDFLTLPRHREAYGRRAREFDDLFVIERPGKALMLARRKEGADDPNAKLALRARAYKRSGKRDKDAGIEVMYLLLKEVEIPHDPTLIPLPELEEVAAVSADNFINDAVEAALPS